MGTLCFFLLLACCFDYSRRKLPNSLLAVMLAVGLGYAWVNGGIQEAGYFLLKAILTILGFYPLFYIGAMGAGDVKLFGICAGYFPGNRVLFFLFFSLLFAAILSAYKLYLEKNMLERLHYLGEYLLEVMRCGRWQLYLENERERSRHSICLAGPVLCSVMLYMGGMY